MLGLADSSARRNLFTAILDGEPGALLDLVDDQYSLGVEPLALMRSLLDLVNRVTVAQVGRGAPDAASAEERAAIEGWAEALPAGQLHRLWQLLLKGHEEVRAAPDPLVTMQMALLRILHAADLPDPGEMARQMAHLAANGAVVASATNDGAKNDGAPASGATASGAVPSWEALVDRIDRGGNLQLAFKLKMQAEPIEIRANYLSYGLAEEFSENFARDVQAALRAVGLGDWQVEQIAGRGKEPTLAARSEQARADAARAMREQPLVKATLAAFPDAELIEEDNGGDPAWSQRRARQA
jgi:DNA polymerase-3 subunit gamma/tau